MAGYPPAGSGYPPYGAPPAQPYYGDAPAAGQKPHKPGKTDPYGAAAPHAAAYGAAPPAQPYYGAPAPAVDQHKPHKTDPYGGGGAAPPPPGGAYGLAPAAYGSSSPFAALTPSAFPPGTDPNVVACFQSSDTDRSGFIDDKEMQRALSSYNQSFSIRTVHLLMYMFTSSNVRKIGPKEFSLMFYSLQAWRSNFERFDRDRSGRIDTNELRDALTSLGFAVPPVVLDLLVSKFDKSSGGKNKSIEYDNFIECCLTVKGLTEKFKEKDVMYSGSANFTYESFMLTVLPFLIA
ncbi:grancalcin [Iris pallida]|uniref:Grancalcin n=1 Tax=Iris pallida TaxID=29817 RepID=A0AAX6IIU8_IRIPA|nr:grancalcin [Iris pallida]